MSEENIETVSEWEYEWFQTSKTINSKSQIAKKLIHWDNCIKKSYLMLIPSTKTLYFV
jgi:hypothetical protein